MKGPRAIEENRKTMPSELLAEKRALSILQAKAEYSSLYVETTNAKLRAFNIRWIAAGGHSGSCLVEVKR